MKKLISVVATMLLGLVSLWLVAGRGVGELRSWLRASADRSVAQITENLPQDVQDKKLQGDLTQVRQELIDRQVKLNLSKEQIGQLRADVERLELSLAGRKRLLAEALPVLQGAERENRARVKFASTDYPLDAFQRELDDLILLQERESKTLVLKSEGLKRLEASAREAELALAEMRRALDTAEQEVDILKSRREQAEIEARALELVGNASVRNRDANESVGRSLSQLREEVSKLEARNDAQRTLAPVSERSSGNQLTRQWSRVEALQSLVGTADKLNPPIPTEPETRTAVSDNRDGEIAEVRIRVKDKSASAIQKNS